MSDVTDNLQKKSHIAIVGGGMVGISLALLLSKTNPHWMITLIENHPFPHNNSLFYQPSFDARSTALAVGSQPILEACGIWRDLKQHLTPITKVHVSDRGHFGGAAISAEQQHLNAVGYVVENNWLGQVLVKHLHAADNIDIIAPSHVQSILPVAAGAKVILSDNSGSNQQTVSSELVVVADGADSPLGKQLGIDTKKHSYDQVAVIANIESDSPHGGVAYERFTDQGPIALLPLGEHPHATRMALVWTLPMQLADEIIAADDQQFLKTLQNRFGFRCGNLIKVGQRNVYPLHLVLAEEQIRRGIVLLGNAAHFLHPVAGQGFNLALRDCKALVDTLIHVEADGKTLGDLSVLEKYVAAQSLDQTLTVGLSDQFVKLFSSQSFAKSVIRNLGVLFLDAIPSAGRLLARQTMGTR